MGIPITKEEYMEKSIEEYEAERDGYRNGQMQLQDTLSTVMDSNAKWAAENTQLFQVRISRIICGGTITLIVQWMLQETYQSVITAMYMSVKSSGHMSARLSGRRTLGQFNKE
jgi:hypothetical protein